MAAPSLLQTLLAGPCHVFSNMRMFSTCCPSGVAAHAPQTVAHGMACAYCLQHFDEPDRFDVNHFLQPKAVALKNASTPDAPMLAPSAVYRPFGHGRKGCVGYLLAEAEMLAIMSTLLRLVCLSDPRVGSQSTLATGCKEPAQGDEASGPQQASGAGPVAGSPHQPPSSDSAAPPLAELETKWEVRHA